MRPPAIIISVSDIAPNMMPSSTRAQAFSSGLGSPIEGEAGGAESACNHHLLHRHWQTHCREI